MLTWNKYKVCNKDTKTLPVGSVLSSRNGSCCSYCDLCYWYFDETVFFVLKKPIT